KGFSHDGEYLRFNGLLFVPNNNRIKLEILRQHHDSPTAGHFGAEKTLELITREFYWPKMRKFITNYCATCDPCQRAKPARHHPYGLLKPLEAPTRSWESVSMDFVVKLPPSADTITSFRYDSIFVVVDRFTKMAHFICHVAGLPRSQA